MNKTMQSNRHNDEFLRKLTRCLKEQFVSDSFGEFIFTVKIQGGVIQQISMRKFDKKDVVTLKPSEI